MPTLRSLALLAVITAAGAGLAPAPAPVAPRAYFIDCSRHTAGDGSRTAPWNTLAAANERTFAPGDRIALRRSTTCHGRLTPGGSGSAGHPIDLGSYGAGGKPTIAGGGTATFTGALQLSSQSYWTIHDLHITNTSGGRSTPYFRSGVLIMNDSDQHLRGLIVERLSVDSVTSNMATYHDGNPSFYVGPRGFGGISVMTSHDLEGGYTGLLIRDNTVSHVGRTGIWVSNSSYPASIDVGTRITGNRIDWTRGDGIVLSGVRNGRIDHNVVAHAADEWPCAECGPITAYTSNAAVWTASSKRVRIDHNEAYGTKTLGGDGEGFDVDSSAVDTVVEYNYSHDNEGGGILFCGSRNAIARFNVLQNNLKSAFAFIGSAPQLNTTIENNTVYISKKLSQAGVVRTFGGHIGDAPTFKNNLIYSYGNGGYAWPAPAHTAGNVLIGRHYRGRPTDATTLFRGPATKAPGTGGTGFASLGGYRMKAGAKPARRGAPIPSGNNHDFFGRLFNPAHPPRGAVG